MHFKPIRAQLVGMMIFAVMLIVSQFTLGADAVAGAAAAAPGLKTPSTPPIAETQQQNPANGEDDTTARSQTPESITRTTSSEEITIEVNTPKPRLALSQNTVASPGPAKDNRLSPASTAEQKGLFRIYRSNLLKKTYQHVIYPESAIDRNQQGDVILKVIVTRKGKIKRVDFSERANFNSLNKAATNAVYNAKPYPAAPARLEGETFEIIMPIRFRLAG